MDCDQVFAVLTRGPFPSGAAEDVLVDEHLDSCVACQLFVEALRPAHDLFHESLPPAEGRRLPCYEGEALPHIVGDNPAEKARRPMAPAFASGDQHSPYALVTRRTATQIAPLDQTRLHPAPTSEHRVPLLFMAGMVAAALAIATGFVWPFG